MYVVVVEAVCTYSHVDTSVSCSSNPRRFFRGGEERYGSMAQSHCVASVALALVTGHGYINTGFFQGFVTCTVVIPAHASCLMLFVCVFVFVHAYTYMEGSCGGGPGGARVCK